jgi:hypothetical protein
VDEVQVDGRLVPSDETEGEAPVVGPGDLDGELGEVEDADDMDDLDLRELTEALESADESSIEQRLALLRRAEEAIAGSLEGLDGL